MTNLKLQPAVYVGTYEKYNNGSIGGAWLKLQDFEDHDAFYQKCKDLHSDEVDPEFMYQDFENMPTGFSKNEDIKEAYETLAIINNINLPLEVIEAGIECEIEPEKIDECFVGSYESDLDFAYAYADMCDFEQPAEWPYNCIDWDKATREHMQHYREHDGHYFRNI